MNLTQEELRELSDLLDQVLELPENEREVWLAGLSDARAHMAPILRKMLANDAQEAVEHVLPDLPQYSDLELEQLTPTTAKEISDGTVVGPYRLLRELGRGGMGSVWLAERNDGTLKRQVALKLPHSTLPQRQLAERFARERDILAALAHSHIARLYDAGVTEEGRPFLALEFVVGEPINSYCDSHRLNVAARLGIFLQVLSAVQYAHSQLVVHRDLKPSNILVTSAGEVKLLDFGIAKLITDGSAAETQLTEIGGRVLTLTYASPEQVKGQPIGTSSDVYALGVVLYELLTGCQPYRTTRNSKAALEEAILTDDPARPAQVAGKAELAHARGTTTARLAWALRGDLETIILKALKKDPAERYATAEAFAADLRRHLAGEPVLARPDSFAYRSRKFVGRHRWTVGTAAIVVIAMIGFTASLGIQIHKVTRERDRADRLAQFMGEVFAIADPSEERSGKVTARELLDTAAKSIDSQLADDEEMRARLVRTMGRAYTQLGAVGRSEAMLRTEYERAAASMGSDDPTTLALGAELAKALGVRWQTAPAEALGRDILARQQRVLGPDSWEVADTESSLAVVLYQQGRYTEAIDLARHSLALMRKRPERRDADLLDEEGRLGYYLLRAGKADPREIETLFRDLVATYRSKLGPGNLKTLWVTNGLALVLGIQRRSAEAVPVLKQAIADGKSALGPEHPRVLDLFNNLAGTLINIGDLEGAEPVLREAMDISIRSEGSDSPRAAMAKYNLACVRARRGDRTGALALLADALDHGLISDDALKMGNDDDLISLRGDAHFVALVARAKAQFGNHAGEAAPLPLGRN